MVCIWKQFKMQKGTIFYSELQKIYFYENSLLHSLPVLCCFISYFYFLNFIIYFYLFILYLIYLFVFMYLSIYRFLPCGENLKIPLASINACALQRITTITARVHMTHAHKPIYLLFLSPRHH